MPPFSLRIGYLNPRPIFIKNKKIIIAGGTGFIGQELCNFFGDENEIIVLGRQLPQQANNAPGKNNIKPSLLKKIRFVK